MKTLRVTLRVAAKLIERRGINAHKGSSGRVLVIAGSRGMVGAAVLASTAAVRSGAGLVRLATVKSQQRSAVIRAPLEITTQDLPESSAGHMSGAALPKIKQLMEMFHPTVLAVGPGLGVTAATKRLVRALLYESTTPLVLDADGLNALAELNVTKKFKAPVVLTPHVGELARLLDVSGDAIAKDRVGFTVKAAKKFGCVCLLKGPGTLIAGGVRVFENSSGNSAMASGGMGDVLTGLVAAAWAQAGGAASKAAACTAFAVFLHGLCADMAVRSFPERTLLASDLIEALPGAFKKIWRNV